MRKRPLATCCFCLFSTFYTKPPPSSVRPLWEESTRCVLKLESLAIPQLAEQMRTLQASILQLEQQNRRADLDVNMLGEQFGQQIRQALHADIMHHKAIR